MTSDNQGVGPGPAGAPGPWWVSADDPHRPRYHFAPPTGWLNDPNGLIQWHGSYHFFYQYADDAEWRVKQWGHAVSDDLVNWRHLPVALVPTPGGPDRRGCWSGCAVDDAGTARVLYSGSAASDSYQLPCLASAEDADLVRWRKSPANPVIAAPPPDLDLVAFRDPRVWREDDGWYLVMGSGIVGVGGAALRYRSRDLVSWEYLGPLCVGELGATEPVWSGSMWECPDFFPIGDRHALVVSVYDREHPGRMGALHYAAYFVGPYAGGRFTPDTGGIVDAGDFYAPQTLLDAAGRRLMWGWLWEAREQVAQQEAGWSGVASLPRVVTLMDGGKIGLVPAPEMERLRREHHRATSMLISHGVTAIEGVSGDCLEIAAEIEPGEAEAGGVVVRRSPDDAEGTTILYDRTTGQLQIDRRSSSLSGAATDVLVRSLRLASDEPLRLRVFLDRSVIEVFANDGVCLTARIYPTRPDSQRIGVIGRGEGARLRALDAWQMADARFEMAVTAE
jgi:beta-fructofuranosidase